MSKENDIDCNNMCKAFVRKETCEYCKANRIVSTYRYKAKRYANNEMVYGYLVKDKKGRVQGILNEKTHYAELAYIDEDTIEVDDIVDDIYEEAKVTSIERALGELYDNWDDRFTTELERKTEKRKQEENHELEELMRDNETEENKEEENHELEELMRDLELSLGHLGEPENYQLISEVVNDAIDKIIELKQYKDIGTVEEFREAMNDRSR